MIFSQDEWPGGNNLMLHPGRRGGRCSAGLDGDTLGLNLDPSHLVWQMIDYERVVREFGSPDLPRPRQGHGDRPGGLYEHGVLSAGIGWQVPRLPGLGEIRWDRFLGRAVPGRLRRRVVVEHEDRGFEGSDEKVKAGFLLARNAVAPYIV